jgi:hypothetical protein
LNILGFPAFPQYKLDVPNPSNPNADAEHYRNAWRKNLAGVGYRPRLDVFRDPVAAWR